jgi:hypothetical protein
MRGRTGCCSFKRSSTSTRALAGVPAGLRAQQPTSPLCFHSRTNSHASRPAQCCSALSSDSDGTPRRLATVEDVQRWLRKKYAHKTHKTNLNSICVVGCDQMIEIVPVPCRHVSLSVKQLGPFYRIVIRNGAPTLAIANQVPRAVHVH